MTAEKTSRKYSDRLHVIQTKCGKNANALFSLGARFGRDAAAPFDHGEQATDPDLTASRNLRVGIKNTPLCR